MINWLSTNAGLKVIAFVLATAVWFFVQRATSDWRIIESVPVEIKTAAGVAVLDNSAPTVDVTVRGTREDVRQVSRQELSVVVDLTGDARRGDITVKLTPAMTRHSRRVKIGEITPTEIQVSIDEVIERSLPVKAQVVGELPPGLEIERLAVRPDTVKIKGPKTILQALDAVPTLPVDLAARHTSFRERVELTPLLPAGVEPRHWVDVDVRIKAAAANGVGGPSNGGPKL